MYSTSPSVHATGRSEVVNDQELENWGDRPVHYPGPSMWNWVIAGLLGLALIAGLGLYPDPNSFIPFNDMIDGEPPYQPGPLWHVSLILIETLIVVASAVMFSEIQRGESIERWRRWTSRLPPTLSLDRPIESLRPSF